MPDPLPVNGFRFALENASPAGIAICITLLVLSSFSWAVMITKLVLLHRTRRLNRRFLSAYRATEHPLDIYEEKETFSGSPAYHIYSTACDEMAYQVLGDPGDRRGNRLSRVSSLRPAQMQALERAMERALGDNMLRLEDKNAILATAVSGAPFLGLLGTVWGVMDAFSGVASASGAVGIKDLAPGVCSALVTTVIGLLVAIPAMFGYNYIVQRIRFLLVELENYAAELQGDLLKFFVRFEPGPAEPYREPLARHEAPSRREARYTPAPPARTQWEDDPDIQDRLL
ncbi:MAG TPA: MotA/TolQ/ExbB proton channel family protein [Verrucomicrobiales bacterium]|nr:MotA/TolQ/ExbB proton channel family protein [Verrucomicrobiales bacterium]